MRPSRFLMPVSGRDISASSEFRSSPSSVLVEFCASATRSQRIEIVGSPFESKNICGAYFRRY